MDRKINNFFELQYLLKPLQNKKGQKILGYPRKKQSFYEEKTAFFSGTPNFFGPSYFEAALHQTQLCIVQRRAVVSTMNVHLMNAHLIDLGSNPLTSN